MGSRRLARRRALGVSACAAVLVLAGCTSAGSTPSISGKTLTIYISDPASLASDQQAQDVVRAEQLAYRQLRSQVTAYRVSLAEPLRAQKISSNARAAIQDSHAIAYLGEIVPGTSADSVGITNAQDVLQVSPTDNAAELTRTVAGVPGSPGRYYESLSTYGQTFARMVPSSLREARALIAEMRSLGVRTLAVAGDGSDYGKALRAAVLAAARSASIAPASSPAGADAVLYAGSSRSAAAAALSSAAAANPTSKLFVASALADDAFVASLSPAAQRALYASAPGFPPAGLTASGQAFVSSFRAAFGHSPAPQAIFGYAAMQAVLRVLAELGATANNRSSVVSRFLKHSFAGSVLGPYSIDRHGDTSLDTFAIERVRRGRLAAIKTVQG